MTKSKEPCGRASMLDAMALQHAPEGLPEDAQIEDEASALEVFGIETHFLGNRQFVAPVDLRPTGNARPQPLHAVLGAQRDQVVLVEKRWTRADETHVATQNAPKLRKFVEARLTQHA